MKTRTQPGSSAQKPRSQPGIPRDAALAAVRKLLERGYTPDMADAEIHMGYGSPCGESWEVRRGRIRAPWFSAEWHSFRALAQEIESGQQVELFGQVAA